MAASHSQPQAGNVSPHIEAALRAARKLLLHAGLLSFFVNMLMLTGPLYMLQIYDRVLGSRSYETLAVITLITFALFAGMAVLDFARGALLSRSADAFEGKLSDAAFDVAMDAGRAGNASAEQPLKDLRQIRQFVSSPALTAVFDAPWTPFFLLLVFLMHWLLGVVAVAGLLILLALAFVNERASRAAGLEANKLTASSERVALSAIRNASAVDAMGMRGRLKKRWRGLAETANENAVLATDRIGGLTATTKATRLFLQSAILGTGAFLAIQGAVTPGVMIAASIIAGRALAPVEIVTSQWRQFALTGAAFERLKKFINMAKEAAPRTALPDPSGALSVDKLVCRPGAAPRPVLKNVSFDLGAGESLGVIGPSAAGKSTLARAIVGVEPALAGEVRLDDADINQWDREALGAFVGFLPQEVELFYGTAASNIARLSDDIDDEKVIDAAKAAGAHEMILGLPDGYDTEIGEGGRHLSAGQRQRLGLARALYGNPKLVVLDEPNANLDADGDAALAHAVKQLKARGATTVIVAHRPAAIAFVDKLLLLVDGEVRALGPRDEILQKIAPRQVAPFNAEARNKQKQAGRNE
ncbi:type I secretion system permease/ATPase [Hyphococcus flavus]|uniref:Type I secretion system permease/ATPase n=1 Tax=Hyphococcus flavus TaxID=1866326 RepID=A0AAE9ZD09_9PROT|nr:type I secretion system permease/ATPase [Hyphococcus flavus]WDI32464.1 type I secretion system permease/ATPase [Hyphococcus flavus]